MMTWLYVSLDDGDGGNVEHFALHDLSVADVEHALLDPLTEIVSPSSGRTVFSGFALDGRKIAMGVEWIDADTVQPITAYEIDD